MTGPVYPEPGSEIPGQPGYVVATCRHRVAASEWRAGFRTCERCPTTDVTGDEQLAARAYHFREAKRLREEADRWLDADAGWKASLSSDDRIARRNSDLLAAQVEATLALADAMRGDAPPARAGTSRYGAEFDRLVSSWQVLEDEHDPIHPDRDECGGVGGCPMMFAAVQLEARMIDELTEWRRSTAVREGRAACSCDHHGDHAGCDHACECAS